MDKYENVVLAVRGTITRYMYDGDRHEALVCGVILQALLDLKDSKPEVRKSASAFFRNEEKALQNICEALGWDHNILLDWYKGEFHVA